MDRPGRRILPVCESKPKAVAQVYFRLAAFLALLMMLSLVTVAFYLGLIHGFTLSDIEHTIKDLGPWGVVASIGLMILHSFIPFPAEFVAICNGMAFGPLWGTVITWVGAMLGASLAFALSRAMGRPFVQSMVSDRNWSKIDAWTAEEGWQVFFACRFIPVIAFNLINYAAGLTRISWWTFLWTTGLGILPLTALMVTMADWLKTSSWEGWLTLGMSGLVLWLIVRTLRRHLLQRA